MSNIGSNMQAKKAEGLSGSQAAKDVASMPVPKGETFAGSEAAQFVTQKQYNTINPLVGKNYLNSAGMATKQSYGGIKGIFTGPTSYGQTPWYQRGSYNPMNPTNRTPGRKQTGGLIGSRLSDTIPGYMEGGLYSSPMVKRYGVGMQSGGSSSVAAGNNSSTVNNNTNANNSFNFNTTVQRDGSLKMGANTTSYEQQDVDLSKNMNGKIYSAIGEVIRREKQFGGSLAGIRNS